MTKFTDGPAAGKADGLCIRRAPLFLRVTCKEGRGGTKATGEWDALDQMIDEPEPNETLYAYRQTSFEGHVHIRRDRKHGGSGFFVMATYAFVQPQPDDATLRDNTKWRLWAMAQRQTT